MSFPAPLLFGKKLEEGQSLDEILAFPTWATSPSITATSGGTVNTSVQIVDAIANVVTVPTAGAGVTIPVALPGKVMLVFNNSSTDLRIFAARSSIDGVTGDTGILVRGQSCVIFVAQQLFKWTYIIVPISLSPQSDWLSAYDTTTQANTDATAEQILSYNTVDGASGISIVDSTKILFSRAGTFNLQFSAQLDKTDSGQDTVEIWLKKNGQAVPWSNTTVDANNNNAKVVAAWNFLVTLAAGDYLQLAWWSADVALRMFAQPAQSAVPGVSPARPAIPSVILTVQGV